MYYVAKIAHPFLFFFFLVECRLFDLYISCETNESGDLINCQCNDAQRRIDSGQIQCGGNELCPDNCEMCKYCLYYVVECHSDSPSNSSEIIISQVNS